MAAGAHADDAATTVVAGNVYPKYTTRNPLARALVDNFLRTLDRLVAATGARDVHEVGCGEGVLATRFAARGCQVRGSDLSPATIGLARARADDLGLAVSFDARSLYALEPARDAAELVVCCEVMEHLPDPEQALQILRALARPHLILSVPREPIWRGLNIARGKYWQDLGNTPGHLQHWSTRAFLRLVRRHAEVVEVATPLPWTLVRARAR